MRTTWTPPSILRETLFRTKQNSIAMNQGTTTFDVIIRFTTRKMCSIGEDHSYTFILSSMMKRLHD